MEGETTPPKLFIIEGDCENWLVQKEYEFWQTEEKYTEKEADNVYYEV